MGRTEPCGTTLLSTAWHYHRTGRFFGHLAAFNGSSLVADGRVARQRVRTRAHRRSGLWQDHLPASPVAPAAASVLSGPLEPLEQVRQGDGADQQPAGQPGRARRHPSQSACCPEADALEVKGQRAPHLWSRSGRPSSLRLVRSNNEQPASADRRYGLASLHLPDDSQREVHRQCGRREPRTARCSGAP